LDVLESREWLIYAEEADLLNMALFNQTAAMWRNANPELVLRDENMRDYATVEQLTIVK
jgi:hypothetical protein